MGKTNLKWTENSHWSPSECKRRLLRAHLPTEVPARQPLGQNTVPADARAPSSAQSSNKYHKLTPGSQLHLCYDMLVLSYGSILFTEVATELFPPTEFTNHLSLLRLKTLMCPTTSSAAGGGARCRALHFCLTLDCRQVVLFASK